ncbi:MAG TPA: hypothetical protein VLA73_10490 [Burkholderiales bacterium]|nr:hypothetical protein [Burkholderiales bacterium]
MQIQIDALTVDLIKEADEVLETSPEPVHAPRCNEIEFPAHGCF